MIIATASFTIPSPNMIEKSLGLSSYFIIVKAATASEAHSVAENKNISFPVKWIYGNFP